MQRNAIFLALASFAMSCASGMGVPARAQEMPGDYQAALKVLARAGDYKDNVLKVSIPRNDLDVSIAGVAMPTPFGFGGWVAMARGDAGFDVLMGDLVLLQEEVNPVMSALLELGLDVTALHNHFFWEDPRISYMHIHGHGKAVDLARRIKPALDLIGHVVPAPAMRKSRPGAASLSVAETGKIAAIVGQQGEQLGPVYKITVGREDLTVKERGATINARMGVNTWAAFYGAGENAAVAGDFAMLENEVTPVLKSLRRNGLEIVAIHHHMTGVRPIVIFLHYWGRGPAEKLANGFRAALDQLGKSASRPPPKRK